MLKLFGSFLLILCLIIFIFPKTAWADSPSLDVTYTFQNIDPNAKNDDIIITTDNGLVLANSTYSNRLFGVVQDDSVIIYRDVQNTGVPIARSGVANVNVSTINGSIKKGDYITSSPIPGKGMRATQSGYVIGTALEDFSGEGGQSVSAGGQQGLVGTIKVALRVEYAEIDTTRTLNRLLEYFNAALFRNIQDPEKFIQIVRYAAAGLIILMAFIISFFIFSRTMAKAVEGIGRNPLAKNAIQFSMIISAALTVAIVLIGIVASFVIIRF